MSIERSRRESELSRRESERALAGTCHQSSLFRLYNMAALAAKIYLVFYNVTLTLG